MTPEHRVVYEQLCRLLDEIAKSHDLPVRPKLTVSDGGLAKREPPLKKQGRLKA